MKVEAFVIPDSSPVHGDPPDWWPKSDGTIGREFLKQFLVVIDYASQKITLYDFNDLRDANCGGTTVPLIHHNEGIFVTEVKVDYGVSTAIWDTGASHSFLKERTAGEKALPLDEAEDGSRIYRSGGFSIGGEQFGPLDFVVLPLVEPQDVDVYIGSNFFAGHTVCINARDGWLRVQASE